jgi:hypothetical protein
MVAAFVLGVELHGGESFWVKLILVLIPALILATAAVLAARIARSSAYERQRAQLDQDDKRLEEQLAHDTSRQEVALAHDRREREQEQKHDREVRARERARDTLDEVIANLEVARRESNAFGSQIVLLDDHRPALRSAVREAEDEDEKLASIQKLSVLREAAKEASRAAFDAQTTLWGDRTRLSLRFGYDHGVTVVHGELHDVIVRRAQILEEGEDRDLSDEERESERALSNEIGSQLGRFLYASRAWDES